MSALEGHRQERFVAVARRWAEQVRLLLGGLPAEVQAAALPWRCRDGRLEILLVTTRRTGRWTIPKGFVKGGETMSQAARREAREEAGIAGRISAGSLGTYHYVKAMRSGLLRPCEVTVFPLAVTDEAAAWPERKRRRRRWFTPAEAALRVGAGPLADMILAFAGNSRE